MEYILEQLEVLKQTTKDIQILIEQRLDFSEYVPEGFGTGDCVIIADKKLHVIDFKYGIGVLVDAKENPQMKLYALGAFNLYDVLYDIEEISMTIFQPRRSNVNTWTISSSELLDWAENELKPKAQLAIKGEGKYSAGHWCQFCKASIKCRARADKQLKLAEMEFRLPPLLSDDEIEEILTKLPELTKWASKVSTYATDMAINHGKEWSGFKVVEGRSNRKYTDENEVAKTVVSSGYKDIYKKSLITLTEMEKLMGKKKFNDLLGELVHKPKGKLTLVPIADKRQAVTSCNVNNEFKKEQ